MNRGREERGGKEMDGCPLTPAATQHDKAVELMQEHNDKLTFDERITFITYLTDNPTAVCTYLALKDDKYREGWVQLIVRRDKYHMVCCLPWFRYMSFVMLEFKWLWD
jgi:hypothetical protein